MGDIVHLHGDPHRQAQELLPWFVNGTLKPAEHRIVEEHLASCPDCAADLTRERRLADLYQSGGTATTDGWAALSDRALAAHGERGRGLWARPGRLAAVAASQLLVVATTATVYHLLSQPSQPAYHSLGAAGQSLDPRGNMVVIFHPDVTEQTMREALRAVDARIVNGPTATAGYVLSVPQAQRIRTLDLLRARPDVTLAQPIDGSALP